MAQLKWTDEELGKAVAEANNYSHPEDIAGGVEEFKEILALLPEKK